MDDGYLLDPHRTVCLCADGSPGYVAAVAIEPNGTEHLVIAEQASLGHHDAKYCAGAPEATHDQLGALPAHWQSRVQLAPLRCGRTTRRGRACRSIVLHPGAPCILHETSDRGRR